MYPDLAEEEKSGDEDSDKKSVDKEVTEPSKQVKRTVMHWLLILVFFESNSQLRAFPRSNEAHILYYFRLS